MNINLADRRCEAKLVPSEPLAHLGFAVDDILAYFLGRGVYRMRWQPLPGCLVECHALVEPRALTFGRAATLAGMAEYLPAKPADGFGRRGIDEGQHRLSRPGSVIHRSGLDQSLTLADLTYGLADEIVCLWAKKRTPLELALSLTDIFVMTDEALTQSQLLDLEMGQGQTYSPTDMVSKVLA